MRRILRGDGLRVRGRGALLHHRPQEPYELARDRHRCDLRLLPKRQMGVALMQAMLCLPRMRDYRRRLPRLASLEIDTDRWAMMITPCGLHEHMPTVTVARFGDRAFPLPIAARILTRHQPQVCRQLRRAFEPPPIDDLRGQHHRALERDPAETLEALHHRRERRQLGEPGDLPIELLTPLQLWVRRASGAAVSPMRRTPVRALAEHEAAARQQELEDIVTRLEDLALERLASPHDAANPFYPLDSGDPHRGLVELARYKRARSLATYGISDGAIDLTHSPTRDALGATRSRRHSRRSTASPQLAVPCESIENRLSFGRSFGSRSTRVGVRAAAGNTATVMDSLCTSMPR